MRPQILKATTALTTLVYCLPAGAPASAAQAGDVRGATGSPPSGPGADWHDERAAGTLGAQPRGAP